MTLIIVGIYVLIGLAIIRPIAGHFAWTMHKNAQIRYPSLHDKEVHPNMEQWTGSIAVACMLACIWPAIILWWVAEQTIPTMGSEKQAQLEAEIKARKERDKELGLEEYDWGSVSYERSVSR